MPHHVVLFTDGGCTTQHPRRPGGWAAILLAVTDRLAVPLDPVLDPRTGQPYVHEAAGHELDTTNQQMEIEAAIQGLRLLKHEGTAVLVVSDSEYVIKTMKGQQRKKANRDRWARLDALVERHDVLWQWTKAHAAGDDEFSRWNNRADALVTHELATALADLLGRGSDPDPDNGDASVPDLICPACGSPMVLRETTRITYKDGRARKFYGCSRWPACAETHGADPDGKPLGVPATQEVRTLRHEVHVLATRIWDWDDKAQRKAMYAWLSENAPSGHIGAMQREELLALRSRLEGLTGGDAGHDLQQAGGGDG
jgi:ribonuclease HI